MKKLLVRILVGLVFFIGGQWIGLEVQSHQLKSGDASAPVATPETTTPVPAEPAKN